MKNPELYSEMDLVVAFIISVTISYLITPFIKYLATRLNYFDHPNGKKIHTHSTPLLGGISIFVAFIVTIIFTIPIDKEIIGIFLGGLLLVIVGLIDDKFGMMPTTKLLGQFLAALTVVKLGAQSEFINIIYPAEKMWHFYLNTAFTCFWIIGITNAINLLDNMNGLSSGLVAISAAFFALFAFQENNIMAASLAMALCGGCLGFLKYNFPRATIFMGDAGSLFVGFCIASIAVLTCWKDATFSLVHFFAPIFILAYPIFDTTLVTVLRVKDGRSIFQGGKDHSSHRISVIGFKRKKTVLIIFLIAFSMGLASFILKVLPIAFQWIFIFLILLSLSIFGILLSKIKVKHLKGLKG